MQRKSSFRKNTAASRPSHKCLHCHKVFHTSNALGGHQHAHRRDGRLRKISPILAAVLAHPILDDDDEPPASPLLDGTEIGGHAYGSMSKQGCDDLRLDLHQNHPNLGPVIEEYPEECITKDLLGEWMLMSGVGEYVGVERSSERTITDPIVRVSKGNEESDEEVTSKGKVDIDLELKLGF